MRTKSKLALTLLGTLALFGGCRDRSNDFYKEGKVGTYDVAIQSNDVRKICIREGKGLQVPRVSATDWDNDGRFDEIDFRNVPKGHLLQEYVSLGKLEQAYADVANSE